MKPRSIYAALVVLGLAVPVGAQVAPIVDEDDSPSSGFYRSLSAGPVLRPPSRSSNAPRPQPRGGPKQPDKDGNASAPSYLNIIVDEPGGDGALPPPERSPRRAAPVVSPKPADRTAAVPPKPEPLPKPRPEANIEAATLPSPLPAESKRQSASVPMPPIPPWSGNAARPHPHGDPTRPDENGDASAPPKPADRTAAVPSKPEPRPDANIEAAALPSPLPVESKPQPASVPMPPIPPRSGNAPRPHPRGGPTQPDENGDASTPPKPADRTAAVPPKPQPLPKPRPDANIEAMPLPSPSPPVVSTRRPLSAPMLLTPPSLSNAAPQPRGGTTQPNKSGNASAPSAPNVIMADPDADDIPAAPENASGNALHSPR